MPVSLILSRLMLIGEPNASPLIPKAHRAKLRFFARPQGILVPPIARRSSALVSFGGGAKKLEVSGGIAGAVAKHKIKRSRLSSSHIPLNANLRTSPKQIDEAVSGADGREILTWEDIEVPDLLLCCGVEDLHKVTLVVSLMCYSRKGSRGGKSKLRGTCQLRLKPPDENGRVVLEPMESILPSACIAPPPPPPEGSAQYTESSGFEPQGPFRMIHCAQAQPFALSFGLRVEVDDPTPPHDPGTHKAQPAGTNLRDRLMSVPRGLINIHTLFRGDDKQDVQAKPAQLAKTTTDPGDIRINAYASKRQTEISKGSGRGTSAEEGLGASGRSESGGEGSPEAQQMAVEILGLAGAGGGRRPGRAAST